MVVARFPFHRYIASRRDFPFDSSEVDVMGRVEEGSRLEVVVMGRKGDVTESGAWDMNIGFAGRIGDRH